MHAHGVSALEGARRYPEVSGYAGLSRAVVSGIETTHSMLELAGLASLVDVRVDAELIEIKGRAPPVPNILLSACRCATSAPRKP